MFITNLENQKVEMMGERYKRVWFETNNKVFVVRGDTGEIKNSICLDGTITREQFWVLAKFKYPTYQIVFCTDEALKCLNYRGFEEVR